ncbi:hypothetical protein JCM6882_001308 [Rhodosporidiobolus microsporus]
MHATMLNPSPSLSAPSGSASLFHPHPHHSHSYHHHHPSRRDSASSSSDEDAPFYSSHPARTSPDLSSLTPSASVPSSPKRAPGLSPSSPSHSPLVASSLSAPASPSLALSGEGDFSLPGPAVSSSDPAVAADAALEEDEEEDEAPITALPGRLPRPKTKLDRERERAAGLSTGGGMKKEGLGKKLARKRADSLKWAKYANVGTFEIELGLSNDDLMRK